MRKIFSSLLVISSFITGCSKPDVSGVANNTEPPVIKIISPLSIPELRPGEVLTIKALFTSKYVLAVAAWEAVHAASVCGNNPYKGEFQPWTSEYEMDINFLVPERFAGEQIVRLYAVDSPGNITTVDVRYKALN